MLFSERIIALIAPHTCFACGKEGVALCEWCTPDSSEHLPPRCFRCYEYSPDSMTCKKCRARFRPKYVWVALPYQEIAKDLIYALKFNRQREVHKTIAEEIASCVPDIPKDTLVVHIPTATQRRRQRGYDQAELIAKAFAKKRGLRHVRLLRRRGQSRQVGSDKAARKNQLRGAFSAKPAPNGSQPILLVDDLITTGATLEAATLALKEAGYKNISAALFAQKQ